MYFRPLHLYENFNIIGSWIVVRLDCLWEISQFIISFYLSHLFGSKSKREKKNQMSKDFLILTFFAWFYASQITNFFMF